MRTSYNIQVRAIDNELPDPATAVAATTAGLNQTTATRISHQPAIIHRGERGQPTLNDFQGVGLAIWEKGSLGMFFT